MTSLLLSAALSIIAKTRSLELQLLMLEKLNVISERYQEGLTAGRPPLATQSVNRAWVFASHETIVPQCMERSWPRAKQTDECKAKLQWCSEVVQNKSFAQEQDLLVHPRLKHNNQNMLVLHLISLCRGKRVVCIQLVHLWIAFNFPRKVTRVQLHVTCSLRACDLWQQSSTIMNRLLYLSMFGYKNENKFPAVQKNSHLREHLKTFAIWSVEGVVSGSKHFIWLRPSADDFSQVCAFERKWMG